jgi:glucose/arabinose dehydrogenase
MNDRQVRRRTALRLAGGVLVAGLAGCSGDDATSGASVSPGTVTPTTADAAATARSPTGAQTGGDGTPSAGTERAGPQATVEPPNEIAARRVASGFTSPVGLEIPQAGRRFIADQPGQVYLQDSEGVHPDPYLDIADRMVDIGGFTEQGLLGVAFHPAFEDNGRLFVRYSAPPREGTPDGYSHTFVLSEFTADPAARRAEPGSERTVLEIPQPQANHNAGAVTFGPDGYLYVTTGDGGRAGDQGTGHVDDWYDAVGGGNGQDVTENLLGAVLRVDVDDEGAADGRNYAVPDDNPLVGEAGLDEHYAWGFRNPWRLSFGPEGRLFVADVGQSDWEEVSIVAKGGNYGWNVREGAHCFDAADCPSESPRGLTLRDPVIEYPTHGDEPVSGAAVIGGYLYDGDDIPGLAGQYVFADWRAGGDLFVATESETDRWPTRVASVESGSQFGPNVLAFARDPRGELFVCTTANNRVTGSTGAVFRLEQSG